MSTITVSSSRARLLHGIPRPRVSHLAVVRDDRALLDVVVEVELECLLFRERLNECRQVAREQHARVKRHRRWNVEGGENRDIAGADRVDWLRQLAVAA